MIPEGNTDLEFLFHQILDNRDKILVTCDEGNLSSGRIKLRTILAHVVCDRRIDHSLLAETARKSLPLPTLFLYHLLEGILWRDRSPKLGAANLACVAAEELVKLAVVYIPVIVENRANDGVIQVERLLLFDRRQPLPLNEQVGVIDVCIGQDLCCSLLFRPRFSAILGVGHSVFKAFRGPLAGDSGDSSFYSLASKPLLQKSPTNAIAVRILQPCSTRAAMGFPRRVLRQPMASGATIRDV